MKGLCVGCWIETTDEDGCDNWYCIDCKYWIPDVKIYNWEIEDIF